MGVRWVCQLTPDDSAKQWLLTNAKTGDRQWGTIGYGGRGLCFFVIVCSTDGAGLYSPNILKNVQWGNTCLVRF